MNVECWLYVVICFRFVLGRQVRAFCCFYDRKNVVVEWKQKVKYNSRYFNFFFKINVFDR